jgi:hypothetical protein
MNRIDEHRTTLPISNASMDTMLQEEQRALALFAMRDRPTVPVTPSARRRCKRSDLCALMADVLAARARSQ